MFGRTIDRGIFVVDTKECRKRLEKLNPEGREEEEGRQSTVIRSKGKIINVINIFLINAQSVNETRTKFLLNRG